MNNGLDYSLFYDILKNLRNEFHAYGRIDDANAKLDEIAKLIMTAYVLALDGKQFSLSLVRSLARENYGDPDRIAVALRDLFESVSSRRIFINDDGTNIFGTDPSLNLQASEDLFAQKLIIQLEKIDFVNLVHSENQNNFDLLNECFGHFIRENFRNNKEDAQYMTPAEISGFVADMVFQDFEKEGYFTEKRLESFTVMDPTCGVGTLLIEATRNFLKYLDKSGDPRTDWMKDQFLKTGVIGQDKVDRMVRLTRLNSLLLDAESRNIHTGNSISEHTQIDDLKGSVDFIYTNPPFGADFSISDLTREDFDMLMESRELPSSLPSEILMLLKCLKLLRPEGKLAIVLPDSVVSAKKFNSILRKWLLENYTINAVIALPSETFAQAGTRTKADILYLTNTKPQTNQPLTMAICEDVGYVVKERKGFPVKISKGHNQMKEIAQVYHTGEGTILSKIPSVTQILPNEIIDGILTPNFYSAERLGVIEKLDKSKRQDYELKELQEVVDFETVKRRSYLVSDACRHISVLHINPDGTIDMREVEQYEPTSKGRICQSDDILFSKINPRIPRVSVVPEYEKQLVCSNEFEILRSRSKLGPHTISQLLKTPYVLSQIKSFTSGTSSSHNRIKREQLMQIRIPVPVSDQAIKECERIERSLEQIERSKYEADDQLQQHRAFLNSLY